MGLCPNGVGRVGHVIMNLLPFQERDVFDEIFQLSPLTKWSMCL